MKYIEIGELRVVDKFYVDEICEVLENKGFQTALIHDGIETEYIRILKERKEY